MAKHPCLPWGPALPRWWWQRMVSKASTANRQLPEQHLAFYGQLCQQERTVPNCPSPKRSLGIVVSFPSPANRALKHDRCSLRRELGHSPSTFTATAASGKSCHQLLHLSLSVPSTNFAYVIFKNSLENVFIIK